MFTKVQMMLDRRTFIKDTTLTAGSLLSSAILPVGKLTDHNRQSEGSFSFGVASGDPLSSQVVIWTRVSPSKEGPVSVKWFVSKDIGFKQIVQSGEAGTDAQTDYTVKIDISGLLPSTTYYYRFSLNDVTSPTGRTKTLPSSGVDKLQFAVVSCSNYSAGYYNALASITLKKDLDAVIHLGDYIYEGTTRSFAPQNKFSQDDFEETHFNRTREWWLHYYRKRYAINRLDTDLQSAHQTHPFIVVWDDHEIANNAWKEGAQAHNEEQDGDWEVRKSAAKQAYAEWMPIRGNASRIFRSIKFGNLAELILLDTRLEGRDQQIYDVHDLTLFDDGRTMLGKEQKEWLLNKLDTSQCQWKLIGSQVIFSEFNVKWLSNFFSNEEKILQKTLLDYWEGYPAERDTIINHISKQNIKNVVILSASMHCALAFDVTLRATKYSRNGQASTYDAKTRKGSIAVEFATTSITSENFDEKMGNFYANTFESLINKKLPAPLNFNPNPHLKFADLQKHGYYILKISKEKAEAHFYFVDHLQKKITGEKCKAIWHTKTGSNFLEKSV